MTLPKPSKHLLLPELHLQPNALHPPPRSKLASQSWR